MKKYKINWCECINPFNWGENLEIGIRNVCDSFPIKYYEIKNDYWLEIFCEDTFFVKNKTKAKQYVNKTYEIKIFSVYNNKNKLIFTEQDC